MQHSWPPEYFKLTILIAYSVTPITLFCVFITINFNKWIPIDSRLPRPHSILVWNPFNFFRERNNFSHPFSNSVNGISSLLPGRWVTSSIERLSHVPDAAPVFFPINYYRNIIRMATRNNTSNDLYKINSCVFKQTTKN